MIDEFFSTIKTAFVLVVIAIVIIIVIVAIVKGKEYFEDKEQERKRKEEILDGINQIKAASKRWERKHQLNFMDYLAKEYNRLEECRHKPVGAGYATQTVIMANISGNIEYFSIDLEGLQDLYYYINNNLNSQSNNGANLRMR